MVKEGKVCRELVGKICVVINFAWMAKIDVQGRLRSLSWSEFIETDDHKSKKSFVVIICINYSNVCNIHTQKLNLICDLE